MHLSERLAVSAATALLRSAHAPRTSLIGRALRALEFALRTECQRGREALYTYDYPYEQAGQR